jgi:CheY-like chemotaxis protein
VVSVVSELLTATRIQATAAQVGATLVSARPDEVMAICRREPVDLLVVDLETPGGIELVRALKQDPATRGVSVIGFYPHVRNELRESALAAGTDRVLPRSAFSRNMKSLLAGVPVTPD